MEQNNNLSKNLKAHQSARGESLASFSSGLGIPRSTIQSVMAKDGNTTLDTLIRIAAALHVSLDELVFGDCPAKKAENFQYFLREVTWFAGLAPNKQERFLQILFELLEILQCDE